MLFADAGGSKLAGNVDGLHERHSSRDDGRDEDPSPSKHGTSGDKENSTVIYRSETQ